MDMYTVLRLVMEYRVDLKGDEMDMIWARTVLDGIAVCVVFNVTVALLWLLVPNAFSKMLPPESVLDRIYRNVLCQSWGFLWS